MMMSNFRKKSSYISLIFMLVLAGCSTGPYSAWRLNSGGFSDGFYSFEHFPMTIPQQVLFDFDSSTLSDVAKAILMRQAAWIKENQISVVILQGHTDPRGTREYNLALGQRRAVAVRDFLLGQGVLPETLFTVSYGKERPASRCDETFCWAQDRRVETKIR